MAANTAEAAPTQVRAAPRPLPELNLLELRKRLRRVMSPGCSPPTLSPREDMSVGTPCTLPDPITFEAALGCHGSFLRKTTGDIFAPTPSSVISFITSAVTPSPDGDLTPLSLSTGEGETESDDGSTTGDALWHDDITPPTRRMGDVIWPDAKIEAGEVAEASEGAASASSLPPRAERLLPHLIRRCSSVALPTEGSSPAGCAGQDLNKQSADRDEYSIHTPTSLHGLDEAAQTYEAAWVVCATRQKLMDEQEWWATCYLGFMKLLRGSPAYQDQGIQKAMEPLRIDMSGRVVGA